MKKKFLRTLFAMLIMGVAFTATAFSQDFPQTPVSGVISSDTDWTVDGSPYVITDNIIVKSGATLTIHPGTIVKFHPHKNINIDGALKAQGTSENPIIFTSLKDDEAGGDTNGDSDATAPSLGDWGRIYFSNSSVGSDCIIEHAIVRYGRDDVIYCSSASPTISNNTFAYNNGDVIYLSSASPTISNNTITHNKGYAISASVDSFPKVKGNTLTGNGGNGLKIRGGTLSTEIPITRYWNNTDICYVITDNLMIGSKVTLVIESGMKVKFAPDKSISIEGALKAQGTSEKPIIFTSLKDDEAGGDTNGDGNAIAPSLGDWGGIFFGDSSIDSDCIIERAIIRYAEGIGCISASPTIAKNTITFNEGGVGFIAASPVIVNNNITDNNGVGIGFLGGGTPVIRGNSITHNASFGIYILGESIPDIGTEVDYGKNSIYGNGGEAQLLNLASNEISAIGNYWGPGTEANGPTEKQIADIGELEATKADIVFIKGGKVKFKPWLKEDQTGIEFIFPSKPSFTLSLAPGLNLISELKFRQNPSQVQDDIAQVHCIVD